MEQDRIIKETKRVVNCFSLFTLLFSLLLIGCLGGDIYDKDRIPVSGTTATTPDWTSTEKQDASALVVYDFIFSFGRTNPAEKGLLQRVRPIRAF